MKPELRVKPELREKPEQELKPVRVPGNSVLGPCAAGPPGGTAQKAEACRVVYHSRSSRSVGDDLGCEKGW